MEDWRNLWCFAQFSTILQFKKREKHPWRSVTFSKAAGLFFTLQWSWRRIFFNFFDKCDGQLCFVGSYIFYWMLFLLGLLSFCMVCGHGGHMFHLIDWFSKHDWCPTGCNCYCLEIGKFTSDKIGWYRLFS